jgi:hypothetical protein
LVCCPSNIFCPGASVICSVIADISIIDNDGILNIYSVSTAVITGIAIIIDVSLGNKIPAKIGNRIASAYIDIDADAWSKWSPSIITATASPTYPGRSPNGIWKPYPPVISIVDPTTIVKWCPAPIVIGDPSISIFCHGPTTICVIGSKFILVNIWPPYISVFGIFNPSAIGRQFIIECL